MRHSARGLRLTIPALLAVAPVGVACGDDDDDSDDDMQSDTSAATLPGEATGLTTASATLTDTGGASDPSATDTDTASASVTATGVDTGPDTNSEDTDVLPDCVGVLDEGECNATHGCEWQRTLDACVTDCSTLASEEMCMTEAHCFWLDDECVFGPV